ncbi:MAG: SDR family oxidoreductase [Polyangiales bacterium]
MQLEGKRVLIVGGSSGIGYAVAEAAIAGGARVTIASSHAKRVEAATQKLGERAAAYPLDVRDEAQVSAYFDQLTEPLDHVISTAGDWGGSMRNRLAELDLAAASRIFDVRFWGALALAKHAARKLVPNGSITFTGGMVAHRPMKGTNVATAMAGGLEHLTRALAVELAPIRVNAVCPGLIRTGIWNAIPEERREQEFTRMTSTQLVPRIGEPAECAQAYEYLMKCGFVTGQVLYVDGGTRG